MTNPTFSWRIQQIHPLGKNRRAIGNNGGNFYFTALYRKLPTLCTPLSVNSTPKNECQELNTPQNAEI